MKISRGIAVMIGVLACGQIGQAELANAITAIVNDAVITYQELEALNAPVEDRLIRIYRDQPSTLEKEISKVRSENLDTLVERQLILHEFKTAGYSLPESVLDELVEETIKG